MTPTEILAAFDTHLPPDIAERAKRAYEKWPRNIRIGNGKIQKAVNSFLWIQTSEGFDFWEAVYNGNFTAARALLQPDYKEMWEKEKELREAAENLMKFLWIPSEDPASKDYDEVYNHYQTLKQKHNG